MRLIALTVLVIALFTVSIRTAEAQRRPKKPSSAKSTATVPLDKTADSATEISLAKNEQDLLTEINLARSNPSGYIKYLEEYRAYYREKIVNFPDGSRLVTNEGVAALNDAIAFLRTLKPQPAYQLRRGLNTAAKLHLDDMLKKGISGHRGSDGSKPEDRISRFGSWEVSVGENIVYDSRTSRNDVIGLIIDDGVANRGHRRNVFSTQHSVVGIAASQNGSAKTMYVITFAGGFSDRASSKVPTAVKY
jgi:uncharacterized protein YkwD